MPRVKNRYCRIEQIARCLLLLAVVGVALLRPVNALAEEKLDSAQQSRYWWTLLKEGKLDIKDKSVIYPKFMGFCVKVYNWADTVFNSYDERYVEGTGKRWKAIVKSDNWIDSHIMHLKTDEGSNFDMVMASNLSANAGVYLQYMAVSVGYSLDMSNVIGNRPINLKKFEFSFTCARFTGEASYTENLGGTYIRRFGNYKEGHLVRIYFEGLKSRSYNLDAYYFFNNRKYSQGAVYNYSKYQKRSAGSFIIGFSLSHQKIDIAMSRLPEELLPFDEGTARDWKFHYNNYSILGGYGYNWVFARNFVFNVTALPMVGWTHGLEGSVEGRKDRLALGALGRMGVSYNIGDAFIGLQGRLEGHWYISNDFAFFHSVENLALNLGVRF